MSGFLRSRRAVGVLVGVVVIHILLAFASFGATTRADLTDLPVGVHNADGGELGDELLAADVDVLDLQAVDSRAALNDGFDDNELYGALVVPEGTTEALGALAEGGAPAEVEVIVNEGANAQAAQAAEGALTAMVDGVGAEVRAETLEAAGAAGAELPPELAGALAAPITIATTTVNETGDAAQAQAPMILTVLLWIGALIATLVSWLALHRAGQTPLGFVGAQAVVAAALAVVQPLSAVATANWVAGLDISLSWELFGVLALGSAAFYLLQSAVLNWIGFGGWPLLVLIWLFSPAVLNLAPEALPRFYEVGIHSWLPVRFPHEAITGVLFFDGAGGAATATAITAAIAIGAAGLVAASTVRLARTDLAANPLARRIEQIGGQASQPTADADTSRDREAVSA